MGVARGHSESSLVRGFVFRGSTVPYLNDLFAALFSKNINLNFAVL